MIARIRPRANLVTSGPQRGAESGLLSTELALLMPVLVLFALVGVYAVQVQSHGTRARSAADAAARTAALYGAPGADTTEAVQRAAQRQCRGDIEAIDLAWVDPDEVNLRPGSVTVELTCVERYGGIAAMVGTDQRAVTSRAVSVLEYWRER